MWKEKKVKQCKNPSPRIKAVKIQPMSTPAITIDRNKELLNAAILIDGYMKENRNELTAADERAFYVAIRELVGLLDEDYKENEEIITTLISSDEDWLRYLTCPVFY